MGGYAGGVGLILDLRDWGGSSLDTQRRQAMIGMRNLVSGWCW